MSTCSKVTSWVLAYLRRPTRGKERTTRLNHLNEVEGVALLGRDHLVVSLHACEEDFVRARGEFQEIHTQEQILNSDVANDIEVGTREMFSRYLAAKKRTMKERNVLDMLNLDTDVVARDMHNKVQENQRLTGVEHYIQTMLSIEKGSAPTKVSKSVSPLKRSVIVDQPEGNQSNIAKLEGINPPSGEVGGADSDRDCQSGDEKEYELGRGSGLGEEHTKTPILKSTSPAILA